MVHFAKLRTAYHRLLLRCIGWNRKHRDGYHMLSYADALAKTGRENVDATMRNGGNFSLGSWLVWVTRGYQTEWCSGERRGERVTREGKSRTGWVVSNTIYRCSTCPPKRKTGRWQRRSRAASVSHVLRKRQNSTQSAGPGSMRRRSK